MILCGASFRTLRLVPSKPFRFCGINDTFVLMIMAQNSQSSPRGKSKMVYNKII